MNKTEFRVLQELKYKSGQIDRRKFITSILATGLTVPPLSLAGRAEAATPKKGGLFRLGMARLNNR